MSNLKLGIPDDYRKVKCPYCNHVQADINVPKSMFSDKQWRTFLCEKCHKVFALMQFVERIYITAGLEDK